MILLAGAVAAADGADDALILDDRHRANAWQDLAGEGGRDCRPEWSQAAAGERRGDDEMSIQL